MAPGRLPVATALILTGAIAGIVAQPAVFRSRVELVTVDATVLGSDGRQLSTLAPADFELKVDGEPRPVLSAQFVAQDVPAARPEPLAANHFTSNERVDEGRLVVVAIDETHIRRLEGRPALQAAAAFVDSLDPLDRIAVTPLSRVGVTEFTRDRTALKRRLEMITGQGDPVFLQFNIGLSEATEIDDGGRARLADVVLRECGRSLTEYLNPARAIDDAAGRDACPEQVEQEARALSQQARTQARISLDALHALIANLKPIDGPKTVVLLSEGMVIDPRLVDLSELAASAHAARVSIYALHLEVPLFEAAQDRVSPTLLRDFDLRGDGLSRLAGATRGAVYRLVGSDPGPFRRIATEISGYYLLAFEAADRDRDGRVHRIEVKLSRGGSVLRARPAFRLPVIAPSARSREQELVGLLRVERGPTELPVRVATYTYAEPGSSRVRVVVSAEAEAAEGAGDVLFGYVLMDQRGVIQSSGAHTSGTGRHAFSTVLGAGAYLLRVAGIDPLGRRGLVERPFTPLVSEHAGLRWSDLILAPVPSQADAGLQPFVDRVTARNVTAYVELYAGEPASLEDVSVSFEVADEDNRTPPIAVPAQSIDTRGRLAVARATVSLDRLPPGRYLARARISRGGQEVGQASRPLTYRP